MQLLVNENRNIWLIYYKLFNKTILIFNSLEIFKKSIICYMFVNCNENHFSKLLNIFEKPFNFFI